MRRNLAATLSACATLWLAGCSDDTTAPSSSAPSVAPPRMEAATAAAAALATEVRGLAANQGITPFTRPAPVRRELAVLGQRAGVRQDPERQQGHLLHDLPSAGARDRRRAQPLDRAGRHRTGPERECTRRDSSFLATRRPRSTCRHNPLFWDGRVAIDAQGRARQTPSRRADRPPPAGRLRVRAALGAADVPGALPRGDARGGTGNELADIKDKSAAADLGVPDGCGSGRSPSTAGCSRRRTRGTSFDDMTFAHASNAIAGLLIDRLRLQQLPWDRFLAGDDDAMTELQLRGAKDFMSARAPSVTTARRSPTRSSTTSPWPRSALVTATVRTATTTSAACG